MVLGELSSSNFTHPISVYPEVGEMLYSLARNLRPRIVIEIGSFIGYSAICFAQAIEDNKQAEGKVYSIDNFLPHYNNPNLPMDIINPLELATSNVERAGLQHRITFLKGFSYDLASELIPKIQYIDLLFIDGDHTYKGVLTDYNLFHFKVRKGGLIIFHDIYPKNCGYWGPRIIIDTLKRGFFKKHYDILELETSEGFGLAICKKLTDRKIGIKDNFILETFRKATAFLKEGESLKKGIGYYINSLKSENQE